MSTFQPAETIDEVIQQLEEIIQWSVQHKSRLGYFPVLYQSVTKAVKEGIAKGRFEDGERMERLDVIFANRYLLAFHQFQQGEKPSIVWEQAFLASSSKHLPVLNHLLLGINAHINLDLGIAAARTVDGQNVEALEGDFLEINRLLFEMVNGVQEKLNEISALAKWSDWFFRKWDERMAEFSLKKARQHAWKVAQRYAEEPADHREVFIQGIDHNMKSFALFLKGNRLDLFLLFKLVQIFEKINAPVSVIEILRETTRLKARSLYI